MSEFRIHHDVNELLSLLQVRGGDGAEGYIDLLQKHRTPYVTTTVSAHSAKVGHTPTAWTLDSLKTSVHEETTCSCCGQFLIVVHLQVKLAEFSKTPEDFLRKYDELKSKNVRNLDPLVYLLSKLCEDKEVMQ